MERRTGSLNVNFREIARELGVSAMTVYRVVNLDPAVRRETRERVTDALNRCGFFTHRRGKRFKVLFDFIDHPGTGLSLLPDLPPHRTDGVSRYGGSLRRRRVPFGAGQRHHR